MKGLLFLVMVLTVGMTYADVSCELPENYREDGVTYYNKVSGTQAAKEFKSSVQERGTTLTSENRALPGFQVQTVTKVLSVNNWSTGYSECNDYKRAMLIRTCKKIESDDHVFCVTSCDKTTWSDDCR